MSQSDDEIIAAVRHGETARYGELVERHQQVLMQYLWNLLSNHHDCEELVQETFLSAFRNLDAFDSKRAAFRMWLMVIARNRALNAVAKRRPVLMETLPEQSSVPTCTVLSDEWRQQLDAALKSLPFEQRSAFVLAEIQELPYTEIALVERIPIGTVKSRVSRAKQQLRNVLPQFID